MNRLKDLREDKDLTQQILANYLGCSQVAYSNYELEKRDIPTEVLCKLADYYGTSTDYLLGRTNNPAPPQQ
ncbi:helix-turn-helix domain-containing protein [Agathobaculum sp.]|uniref:helix-turn-helix domain-containing protein n=1 Tax=Agathobaculum sp. TaxID=2048138 RepID=UPI002A81260C|nr:helix-turn-helix transcriptional regulator [Agathobaculum sp.]MDY3617615.1 helix-turn-helix transcriptional regulator [Agathobaculum sp.]